MKSIGFPKIFLNRTTTNVIENKDATISNMKLLLGSEQGSLKCDPEYGIALRARLFSQNSEMVKDIIIDSIYTQLKLFMPQVYISRKDVELIQDGKGRVYCKIKLVNQITFKREEYTLHLLDEGE